MGEKKKKNIAIVIESGKDIGYGHLYREIAIAESFISKGCEVTFFCNEDVNQLLHKKLPEVFLNKWNRLDEECLKYDIIVFDVYKDSFSRFGERMKKCETNNITTAIVIDFVFKEHALNTDYVFQIGYQSYSYKRTDKELNNKKVVYYSGSDFLVFRKEFDKVETHKPKRKAEKILISMGGSDPFKLTELAHNSILYLEKNLMITCIFGAGYDQKRIDDIKSKSEKSHHEFRFYQNIDKMSTMIIKHDLSLINGGNTRFEMAKLGMPFISIAVNSTQNEISNSISNDGIGLHFGQMNEINSQKLNIKIIQVIEDYELRKMISKKMTSKINKNGSTLITKAIIG